MTWRKHILIVSVVVMGLCSAPVLIHAGTLTELDLAIDDYSASGEIYNATVYQTLKDLVVEAQNAADPEEENGFRGSIIDMCNAFKDAGITTDAVNDLIALAGS